MPDHPSGPLDDLSPTFPRKRPGWSAGPKTEVGDAELTELIRQVIVASPFAGKGHRKVRARLARQHQLVVGKNRVRTELLALVAFGLRRFAK